MSTVLKSETAAAKTPPGPRGHFLLGAIPGLNRDPLAYLLSAANDYGDVVQIRSAIWKVYLIRHPDDIKRVLQENNRNYSKKTFDYEMLKPLVGEGLLTSEGDTWLRQRRLIQPAFHRQRIHDFSRLMTASTEEMLERWQAPQFRDRPFNVAGEMMRLTLSIVSKALFSQDVGEQAELIGRSFSFANEDISLRLRQLFAAPLSWPTPRNLRFKRAVSDLNRVVDDLIASRRAELAPGARPEKPDLLTMLLQARDEETQEGMTDRQLRDEVLTLLLAGHETTANAMAWTWYLLSQHTAERKRLQEEVRGVLGGRTPTMEDLPRLRYTQQVIQEVLRLYPPAWIISRLAEGEDELGGYPVPAGLPVTMSSYITHRHPEFWPEPEKFDPERFTPEASASRPAFAFFPFGGGPRLCIGRDFALTEAALILATMAQRLELHMAGSRPVEMDPLITLRPKGGLWMMYQEL